jgi:flagellar biosynthetic protein FlhB
MADNETDAEDKTEEPSQKKLDDALKRGDVVKSQEVSSLFILGTTAMIIAVFAGGMSRDLARPLAAFIDHVHEINFDRRGLTDVLISLGMTVATVLALPAIALLVAGVAGNMIQHRFVWSAEQLTPKLSKISPIAGFGRIFSMEGLANFIKGIVKIIAVGIAIWIAVQPELVRLDTIVAGDISGLLLLMQQLAIKALIAVLIVMAFVAALDYLFQRQRWMKRQRMTREEMKEEFKQTEGNPEVKAKIRQLRQERARRRMMAQVPSASVVVTNPTHYAIALRYEEGMQAPVCVAKGADLVALKIREIATANDVPLVENPPLARALHATADLDRPIPEEHYRAVAEVIGFVMRLRQKRGWKAT